MNATEISRILLGKRKGGQRIRFRMGSASIMALIKRGSASAKSAARSTSFGRSKWREEFFAHGSNGWAQVWINLDQASPASLVVRQTVRRIQKSEALDFISKFWVHEPWPFLQQTTDHFLQNMLSWRLEIWGSQIPAERSSLSTLHTHRN